MSYLSLTKIRQIVPSISFLALLLGGLTWGNLQAKAVSFTNTLPNGVAAGDTTQSGSVLWTHSTTLGNVTFDYSTDSSFSTVLGSFVQKCDRCYSTC